MLDLDRCENYKLIVLKCGDLTDSLYNIIGISLTIMVHRTPQWRYTVYIVYHTIGNECFIKYIKAVLKFFYFLRVKCFIIINNVSVFLIGGVSISTI